MRPGKIDSISFLDIEFFNRFAPALLLFRAKREYEKQRYVAQQPLYVVKQKGGYKRIIVVLYRIHICDQSWCGRESSEFPSILWDGKKGSKNERTKYQAILQGQ